MTNIDSLEINGMPAARVEMDTAQGKSVAIFLMTEPTPMVIQAYGDVSHLDAILATLRLVV